VKRPRRTRKPRETKELPALKVSPALLRAAKEVHAKGCLHWLRWEQLSRDVQEECIEHAKRGDY
jgi:hypothetical protein